MEKDSAKVQNSPKFKMNAIASSLSYSRESCCSPKKEECIVPPKEVISDKRNETSDVKSIDKKLIDNIIEKVDDINSQTTVTGETAKDPNKKSEKVPVCENNVRI